MFLGTVGQIFKNPVDTVFFGAIIAGVTLFVIFLVVSKVLQIRRDKKYEAIFDAKKKEASQEETSNK